MKTKDRYRLSLSMSRWLAKEDTASLMILDFLFSKKGRCEGWTTDICNAICERIRKKGDGDSLCNSISPRTVGIQLKRMGGLLGTCFSWVRSRYRGRSRYAFEGMERNGEIRLLRIALECELEERRHGRDIPYDVFVRLKAK